MKPVYLATCSILLLLTACGGGGSGSSSSSSGSSSSSSTGLTAAQLNNWGGANPSGNFIPAKNDTAAYNDTRLQITFDAPPTLGTTGLIKVYKSDGTLVDTIDVSATVVNAGGETQTTFARTNTEIDKIGNNVPGLTQWRFTYYRPVTITGNKAVIKLHDNVLDFATSYYVTMDNGVLNGTVGGTAFTGFSAATDWTFTTKKAPTNVNVIVDDDGPADFRSVQGALNWEMWNGCTTCGYANTAKTITIKNGTYDEQLFLRNVSNLSLVGESRDGVIVQTNNFEAFNSGTGGSKTAAATTLTNIGGNAALGNRRALGGGRPVLLIEGGDMVTLTNFTLKNTHVKDANTNGQAETIYFNSATLTGSRLVATNMNFLSTQDTIQVKGWVWIYNSLISGDVDFIWGSPFAVALENDELHTVVDTSAPTSGGFVFQARSAKGFPGFVVLNSSLTADAAVPAGSTYLARSSGVTQAGGYCTTPFTSGSLANGNIYCDNVAYINTKMGTHVATAGWWNNPLPNLTATATEGWRESGSMNAAGAALSMSGRNTAISSSTADLSGLNSRAKIFASWNNNAGWTPAP
ncbi:hypothetical protein [Asticcacaulis solisilvae]|uniref:hypothetical protein n=1 Tax=Asticcacaulis solisilvae TaxID=1217274 RepID=UPI003FD710EE